MPGEKHRRGLCESMGEAMTEEELSVVVITDTAFINGGASKVALTSARALAEQGAKVTVFSGVGPVDLEILEHRNIKNECLHQYEILSDPNRLRAMGFGIWNPYSYRRLRLILEHLNPASSIVHIHSWTKSLSASVIRAAIDSRLPIVVTLHDYFSACPLGSFYNHRRHEICRLPALSSQCVKENCDSRSYSQKLWRTARQVIQNKVALLPMEVHEFISVSRYSEAILRPYFRNPSTNVHWIPNPIDVEYGLPAEPASNVEHVYIGRLSKEKGGELFAQATAAAGVPAAVIGDGETASAMKKINPSLQMHGWKSPAETRALLRKARAVVFPSLWYETAGMVPLEAAALGIPTIVADDCAAAEAVINGVTGAHFTSGNAVDLARRLTEFGADGLVASLGGAAYNHYWSAPSTMSRHVNELVSRYLTIIRTHNHESPAGPAADRVHNAL